MKTIVLSLLLVVGCSDPGGASYVASGAAGASAGVSGAAGASAGVSGAAGAAAGVSGAAGAVRAPDGREGDPCSASLPACASGLTCVMSLTSYCQNIAPPCTPPEHLSGAGCVLDDASGVAGASGAAGYSGGPKKLGDLCDVDGTTCDDGLTCSNDSTGLAHCGVTVTVGCAGSSKESITIDQVHAPNTITIACSEAEICVQGPLSPGVPGGCQPNLQVTITCPHLVHVPGTSAVSCDSITSVVY